MANELWPWLPAVSHEMEMTLFAVEIALSGTSLGTFFACCFHLEIWKALYVVLHTLIHLCSHWLGAQFLFPFSSDPL